MSKLKVSLLIVMVLAQILSAKKIKITNVEAKYTNYDEIKASKEIQQSINIGFSNTTGNTKTLNLNGKYDFSWIVDGYKLHPLKISFDSSAFLTKNNGVKSNEEYIANLGLEQTIDDGWLFYTGINWLRNPEFKNYDTKLAINVGMGNELYNKGRHLLIAKLGVAHNIEDYSNHQDREHFTSLNEYLEYNNKLNEISHLYLKIGSMQNFNNFKEDYEALSVLGLSLLVEEKVHLTIEEEIAYDNFPAVGFLKTDTKSIVRLGYKF